MSKPASVISVMSPTKTTKQKLPSLSEMFFFAIKKFEHKFSMHQI